MKNLLKAIENFKRWEKLEYNNLNIDERNGEWETKNLILVFAEDREEYVCRRALLAMPAIRPDKVECYAELFWNRKLYGDELQKYQKMAVLEALKKINSPLLSQYLEMAKVEEEKITN